MKAETLKKAERNHSFSFSSADADLSSFAFACTRRWSQVTQATTWKITKEVKPQADSHTFTP